LQDWSSKVKRSRSINGEVMTGWPNSHSGRAQWEPGVWKPAATAKRFKLLSQDTRTRTTSSARERRSSRHVCRTRALHDRSWW